MLFEQKTIPLKNGKAALLRSPELSDAAEMVAYLKATAEETPFLLRYGEECTTTVAQEEAYLRINRESPNMTMIVCEVEGELAGTCQLTCKPRFKENHRGRMGIALRQAYWGLGIGTALLREMIAIGEQHGLEQLELEVFEGNKRAIALYEKMGFRTVASLPNAVKLKDGTRWAEYTMVRPL